MNAASYKRMLKLLLPQGRLWRRDEDSVLDAFMAASADELERVDDRGQDLIRESRATETVELLPEYEAMLELEPTGTEDERRARVVARLIARQRFRPADVKNALAPLLGQDADDVGLIENHQGDPVVVADEREIYRFFVYRDPTEPGTYDLEGAQTLLDAISHSHTKGHVIESVNFLWDDPYSLWDRDIWGA